ncbi:uncharacterized protein LOC119100440 [Pollicipes pollicipes]|uniref:uncharacterized protein LOC119100440 n=1 Tax=Pollicipes pollicipes TaxID=41117 RepID=UPI0018858B91|nr:uncharacterized protein LOC119100440 [Pollicipes pollicipes]
MPVVICEPEGGATPKAGRTFFFVAKPPVEVKEEPGHEVERAPAPVAPAEPEPAADTGVLKRLAKYQLSEKYEILPAASPDDADDIIHRLRLQSLALKTELVRMATEYERDSDEGGKARRGRKKVSTLVAVDRLRELEKIEAGMHSLFTPSQVKALARDYKKNSVQWRDEDFRRALGLLEASSVRAFNYVRKEMNVPLPSIGTLKLRCPLQPELHERLDAALRDSPADARCKNCNRRASTLQTDAGDAADQSYQQLAPAARRSAEFLTEFDPEEDAEEEEDEDEEEYEEVEEQVEVDPQEVPVEFARFRHSYGGGWNEWDPRQLQ